MTTTFLQELLFRKLVCSWLAPYSIVTALVSTSLFSYSICPPTLPTSSSILEWDWLSLWSTKRENLSATISLHILWNIFTLGATILVISNPM
ncbi:MAG: type II CAAX prenyl endopeptidase Rce1 family protein [Streptococcus salivarius]